MKINYYIVNPGGNITAIVQGKFAKRIKLEITKKILKNNPTIEQVGFWTNAKNKKFDARLEMAGGEFCGNALRALGSMLFLKYNKKFLYIESPIFKIPIKVNCSRNKSSISLPLSFFTYKDNICSMPGIIYILQNKKVRKSNAKFILSKNRLLGKKASGVIGYEIEKNKLQIYPNVWVRDTKTMYAETACASGTLALAYMLYKKIGVKKLNIKQPSGFIFKTIIIKKEIKLSGPIISIKKETTNI